MSRNGYGLAPAVHTRSNHATHARVDLTDRGIFLRLECPNGRIYEGLLFADQALKLSGALRLAAKEYERRLTLKVGEVVGRM